MEDYLLFLNPALPALLGRILQLFLQCTQSLPAPNLLSQQENHELQASLS